VVTAAAGGAEVLGPVGALGRADAAAGSTSATRQQTSAIDVARRAKLTTG
jgi:hypothetical protein